MARIGRAVADNGWGLALPTITFPFFNQSGSTIAKGELVMLDEAASEAANYSLGAANSAWATVINPTSAGLSTARHVCGIAAESINDGQSGNVVLQGHIDYALVYASSGSPSAGDLYWGDPTQKALEWNSTGESDYVYLARAQADVTTPTSPTAASVLFVGFGLYWGLVP